MLGLREQAVVQLRSKVSFHSGINEENHSNNAIAALAIMVLRRAAAEDITREPTAIKQCNNCRHKLSNLYK